ncbi:hypothetical protein QNO07_09320 [Streptomyces sp. 549]|uniref:hypothetical protein n=1 Tax=Streptomyces sp. 549 TaxID=3049076 RepID=UPI0024C3F677|nr:hypothetical protein [Streptomyces sp. 549]MDK1473618.1 hypothetical protein [Streptomyces sp. 549]
MSLYVCSLISNAEQVIPADGQYHLLRFPYGEDESYDAWNMHPAEQPDGLVSIHPDVRSALIWPAVKGWGELKATIHWAAGGGYTEVRSQLIRDPLGLAAGPDTTCTEDHHANVGGQFRSKSWGIFVNPVTSLGVRVRHNGTSAATVTHAQFKLVVNDDVAVPPTPGGL